jgi:putative ABC transport system ATP-binding protein
MAIVPGDDRGRATVEAERSTEEHHFPMDNLEREQQVAAAVPVGAASPGADVVVGARDVTRRFGTGDAAVDALRGVDVDVPRGQFLAVMGPSGSGKSTLMHILAGLDRPTSGSVTIDGVELVGLAEKKLTLLRREKIGFVFQFFNLLPMLTAGENIELPLRLAGRKSDDGFERQLIDSIGLADRLKHRPAELSGGQQQRVAVARALVSRPTVVFADEPTGNLDSKTSGEVLEIMRRSADEYGQTIVMVTHDAQAASIADRVLFLRDGLVVRDAAKLDTGQILDEFKGLDS